MNLPLFSITLSNFLTNSPPSRDSREFCIKKLVLSGGYTFLIVKRTITNFGWKKIPSAGGEDLKITLDVKEPFSQALITQF